MTPSQKPNPSDWDGTIPLSSVDRAFSAEISKGRFPQVPGYEILECLGQGTYGTVWLAREVATGIQVAIKILHRGASQQWELLQAEVMKLAALDAVPGIVQLKEICARADPPYYTMSLAENGSLEKLLGQRAKEHKGPLPIDEALPLFRRLAEALAYVHAKGIRHCDLKPGNVLLDARGQPLLSDFGQSLGTFFYMAPEQAEPNQIPDTRWDVHGLGALFYEMITGSPPRAEGRDRLAGAVSAADALRRYRDWVAVAPRPAAHRKVKGMDSALATIIDCCLEVQPGKRLHDAGAVLAALRRRQQRRRQRRPLLFGVVAPLLLLVFMVLAGLWSGTRAIEDSQRDLTEQLLDSDEVSARLIANAVEDALKARIELLRQTPDWEKLSRAVEENDRVTAELQLRRVMRRALATRSFFSESTVSNRKGEMLAVLQHKKDSDELVPFDLKKLRFSQFSWRDWFSGIGDQPDRTRTYPPIASLHLSDPYRSSSDEILYISISLPIPPPGTPPLEDGPARQLVRNPVGVLEAAVQVADISRWLPDVTMKNGFAVLLDRRRYCVLHTLAGDRILPAPGETPRKFDFSALQEQIRRDGSGSSTRQRGGQVSGKIPHFRDPVLDGHNAHVAGYATFADADIGWVALVEHNGAAVIGPTEKLKSNLISIGWLTLTLAGVLTVGLWAWLLWLLHVEEDVSDG